MDSSALRGEETPDERFHRGEEAGTYLNTRVFAGASIGVVAIALWASFWPASAHHALTFAVDGIARWFGGFYIALATVVLVFVIALAFSRFGTTRLGSAHARPEFSTFAWASMLFAAGIGTDIMFFAVAEPVSHYLLPPVGDPQTTHAAREAITWTLFHYGITGWGMYALMGIALGYFAYNRKRPLAVRSSLSPVLGKYADGIVGDLVDMAAILGTIFGVAATLGIGVVQLNVGLELIAGIEQGIPAQIALVLVAIGVSILSASSGVNRGIRFLSQLNVILAIGLAAWVLITGKTDFFLRALVMNVGDFLATFPLRTLETFAYSDMTEWMSAWTLFFWAWWVAWASFVGMFLARVSRGRTLREFVMGTMVIPFLYVLMWIGIFGNAALDLVRGGDTEFGRRTLEFPEYGFYSLIQAYPGASVVIIIATLVGLLFYITSADSGALVMANLSSYLPTVNSDAPRWIRVWWAVVTGALTVAMLSVGGIPTLQNATIVMGLPFAMVMVFVMIGLYLALRDDAQRRSSAEQSSRNILTGLGVGSEHAGASWQQRIGWLFRRVTDEEAVAYLDRVAQPAFEGLVAQFGDHLSAEVVRGVEGIPEELRDLPGDGEIKDALRVSIPAEEPFIYQIIAVEGPLPAYGGAFTSDEERTTRLEVHVLEGGQDYDVMGYSTDALIHDVLNQFDRHQDYLRLRDYHFAARLVGDGALEGVPLVGSLREKKESLKEKTGSLKAAAAGRMKFRDTDRGSHGSRGV